MKVIYIISPEPWGVNYVSKHHYALELAEQGDMVYFINRSSDRFQKSHINQKLCVIDYKPHFRGIRILPSVLQALFTYLELINLEKKIGEKCEIIWCFDSSRFFNLSMLKSKLRICHIVDMAENIKRDVLAKTSDICFCTSDHIKHQLEKHNSHVFKIHHGVKIYNHSSTKTFINHRHKIQVGYVGNLSRSSIDWKIWNKLINKYKDVQFNFIGNYQHSNLSNDSIDSKQLKSLLESPNVNLIGPIENNDIQSFLGQCDLLGCFYKIENEQDIKQHSNLHKTMEYLASGKIIVCSYSSEYENKSDLLEMTYSNEKIPALFDKIVTNIGFYNSDEKINKRKYFALNNTYFHQIKRIKEIISEYENSNLY